MIRKIRYYSKNINYYLLAFYIFVLTACSILNLYLPIITGAMIDNLSSTLDKQRIISLCLQFSFSNILVVFLKYVATRVNIRLQANSAYKLISVVVCHIQKLSLSWTSQYSSSYLNQRINNDSNALTTGIINFCGEASTQFFYLFISFSILVSIDFRMALIFIFICSVYLIVYLSVKKIVYDKSKAIAEEQAIFFTKMLDQLSNLKFLKLNSLFGKFKESLENSFNRYYNIILKSQTALFLLSSLDSIIGIIAYIVVFIYGGNLVLDMKITLGEYIVCISYYTYLLNSIKYFSSVGKTFQECKLSIDRLDEILDVPEETNGNIEIEKIARIECRDLSYSIKDKVIISSINYIFLPGNIYCITGENGVGKTTLIDLLLGLKIDDYCGQILINDIEIKAIDMYELRLSLISIIEQDPYIFEGNLANNIQLTEFHTRGFELDFLNESISADGSGYSGGEKQKIALARLFSKKADLYVMDEPTSALDKDSKVVLMKYIKNNIRDSIVILISHDKDIIKCCDNIIKL